MRETLASEGIVIDELVSNTAPPLLRRPLMAARRTPQHQFGRSAEPTLTGDRRA
jgi:hypothetical protein